MKVALFPTCLVDLLFPDVASSASNVLKKVGCEVETPEDAVCCGQVAWNSGHVEEARRVASSAVTRLSEAETVVCCAGSCATMIRHHWPDLFADTELAEKARGVSESTLEFSEFVDRQGLHLTDRPRLKTDTAAVYHDSCHMLRGLGIADAPRRLLEEVDGLDLTEPSTRGECCGFGGSFSLRFPELSTAIADVKLDDVDASGVGVVIGSDPGCLMHLAGRAEARGMDLGTRHVAEVLDEALRNSRPPP